VEEFPATYFQKCYFDAAGTGWSNLNVPVLARLHGKYDGAALQLALDDLVLRHEALRTRLVKTDSGIVQRVPSRDHLELQQNTSLLVECDDPMRFLDIAMDVISAPFQVHDGQLIRATLISIRADEAVLIVNAHHAICDGWSTGILYDDLAEFYRARRVNRPARLPQLDAQLGDYAYWERDVLEIAPPRYWREQLSSPHPRLRIGYGAQADHLPADLRVRTLPTIPAAVTQSLAARATTLGTSLPRLLAAIVVASLREYADDAIIVGLISSNRHHPELRHAVGNFANQVPVHVQLSQHGDLSDLVQHFDDSATRAYDNQVPIATLSPLLRSDPGRVSGPLCDVHINYIPRMQNASRTATGNEIEWMGSSPFEWRRVVDRWWKFMYTLSYVQMENADGGLDLLLAANFNSITSEQADDLENRFITLLDEFSLCRIEPSLTRATSIGDSTASI
jgi:hypothetical protein